MAKLMIDALDTSGINHDITFLSVEVSKGDHEIQMDIKQFDSQKSILGEDLLYINKEEAKQLVAYLKSVFDI